MNKVTVKYRFPMEMFYQTTELAKVNKLMHEFGFDGDIGLGGNMGYYNMSFECDEDITLPDDLLQEVKKTLQEGMDLILKDDKFANIKVTIQDGEKIQ